MQNIQFRNGNITETKRYWHEAFPMVALPFSVMLLNYSHTAFRAINSDTEYSDKFTYVPTILNPSTARLVEIDVDSDGQVIKYLYETEYTGELTLSLAITCKSNGAYLVKTMWLNKKGYNEFKRRRNYSIYDLPDICYKLNQETKEFIKLDVREKRVFEEMQRLSRTKALNGVSYREQVERYYENSMQNLSC